ncbi:MAG TPA: outer membrane beta-barrel protein [bacterium]|nr:outer membrane beta-barrel protein [bacterium]HMW33445.1 outer membrane beta-barrel protein [bacterium]HMW36431.1 outer membrane beta-barrel protein [bacterium]HMY35464.1 outer membrane beta-barrel protein [bacterium]HMZ03223.1 outer membrane beta-barrel protein [bacterium]
MKKLILVLLFSSISLQAVAQENNRERPNIIIGGDVSPLSRGSGTEDHFFIAGNYPINQKIHVGLSYGFLAKDAVSIQHEKLHQIGSALGYRLGQSGSFLFFAKTELAFFYKPDVTKRLDKSFFRHTVGGGVWTRLMNRFFLNTEINIGGFFYGRNEPVKYQFYNAADIKTGIGFQL